MPSRPRAKRKRPDAYHHGDLKAALVACATDILKKSGPEALTLRAVARAAGVSEAAPYRHFADRRELVAAVAEDGFRRLQQAMITAIQKGGGGRDGLRDVAKAYVSFAHANPAEYHVMFGPEMANTVGLDGLRQTSRAVLGFVAQGIAELQKAGMIGPGDPALMAAVTWAQLHGLVMLSLDGQSAEVAPSIDVQVQEATRIMMFGMAPR